MKQHAGKCRKNINLGLNHDMTPAECDCDGYHTFDELYDHRITLFIALCRFKAYCQLLEVASNPYTPVLKIWRSRKHSDGGAWDGWFILGIGTNPGEQITYHLPISRWKETDFFAEELEKAPEWDGHTSDDVLDRLNNL